MKTATVLMYHEIERQGRDLCDQSAGYKRYVVGESTFAAHLSHLETRGGGASVAQGLQSGGIALTFDDGCASDLEIAAPLLSAAGFGATFYIVAGWIGRAGFLDKKQLLELADAGFEIGSHGQTHAFLSDLSDAALRAEMHDSKTALEQLTGREIAHFSCPGGRFDARVAHVARELGYASVATSRAGTNSPGADPFRLARMAVVNTTSLGDFERMCRGQISARDKVCGAVLGAAKRVLGNGAYQKLRGAALEKSASGAAGAAPRPAKS